MKSNAFSNDRIEFFKEKNMAKGVTELVEDFKELHPRAYARIYNQALEDFMDKLPYSAMVRMSTLKKIAEEMKEQKKLKP